MAQSQSKKQVEKKPEQRLLNFLFEVGTLRKVSRIHRQTLLEDDLSDNIATHSFRVAFIGWHLAELEGADSAKVTMMCLMHDLGEARSNDHNWIHKRYVKVFDHEIMADQFRDLPNGEKLSGIAREYHDRKSVESRIAKDADLIDQLLLLKEYVLKGNTEAKLWLDSKLSHKQNKNSFFTKSAANIANEIKKQKPSEWWENVWTSTNRS